jgi:carboxypeptidase T
MVRFVTRTVRYVLLLCALVMALPGTAASQQPGDDLQVVRVAYSTKAELAELASMLDIWEVRHDQGILVALVSFAEMMWLTKAGFTVHLHSESIQHADTIPGFPCYRTLDKQYALLNTWLQHYPHLVQIHTIGQSYEGRDLQVIRITNDQIDGIKPVFFLMANIHGRELITNETALDFAEYLLESYTQDADITWILDQPIQMVTLKTNLVSRGRGGEKTHIHMVIVVS